MEKGHEFATAASTDDSRSTRAIPRHSTGVEPPDRTVVRGTGSGIELVGIKQTSATSVADSRNRVETFQLYQNYPNPFNPTTIRYELPAKCFVTLKLYDVSGRDVKTLLNEVRKAGR